MARSTENAAGFGLEREHMAGLDQVAGFRLGVREQTDREGSVLRADACADAVRGIYGNGEVCFEKFAVGRDHALQIKLGGAFLGDWSANQPSAEFRHEIHRVCRDFRCRHHQVAFIFPIGIIRNDDHAASADIGNHGGNRIEWRFHGEVGRP